MSEENVKPRGGDSEKPDKRAEGFLFTKRDRDLLRHLYNTKYLRTDQLCLLMDGERTRTSKNVVLKSGAVKLAGTLYGKTVDRIVQLLA